MPDDYRAARPIVIFDGDCGFCRFWLERWSGPDDPVEYVPFQAPSVAERFPTIPHQRFVRAVHLVECDGRISFGAEAVFRLLAVHGTRWPLALYQHVPGVQPLTESVYRLVAANRPFFWRLTTWLWGRTPRRPSYALATWLFLRVLGLVYLAAFASLGLQILGLVGHDGILPADSYMAGARQLVASDRWRLLPTLAWVSTSDPFLRGLCVGGAALSALLMAGVAPAALLPLLWFGYLSLSVVCREFLYYQWDVLLLETGLLAILIAPWTWRHRLTDAHDPPRPAVWLFLWLLFRLMVGSGLVKLASGDPTWHGLTALSVHFESQPIPTPLAWYAHRLPLSLLKASTALVLAIEGLAPWLMLAPRRLRMVAFWLLVGLQAAIAATGNYAFFNLLSAALCLFLLDDAAIEGVLRMAPQPRSTATLSWGRRGLIGVAALVTVPVTVLAFLTSVGLDDPPGWSVVAPVAGMIAPFRSANTYGLFAVMTTSRLEIVVEGSNDGTTWREYEFKAKPGDLRRPPPWVAPHQPRLDWQMWFASLSRYQDEPWFESFLVRLLEGSPSVLRLLARDPFNGTPPRYIRAAMYQYHFSSAEGRRTEGVWWTREQVGDYAPVMSLRTP
jgi:predicted DCC family thiol-disulfide oxidoreductase YuxK